MRKSLLLLASVAALLCSLLAASPASAATGSISGTIPADYGDAEVYLFDLSGQAGPVQTYAYQGSYAFDSLSAGTYAVCWNDFYNLEVNSGIYGHTAYRDCWNASHYVANATPVQVGQAQAVTGIDLVASPWGIAEGDVYDAQGAPVEDGPMAHAMVWDERQQDWQVVDSHVVDWSGHYQLVVATGQPFRICADFQANMGVPGCLGGRTVEDATDHTVGDVTAPGGHWDWDQMPDFSLPAPAEIAGAVHDAEGNPIANVSVGTYLKDANGEWQGLPPTANGYYSTTDSNGAYRLPWLAAGTYRVCFVPTGFEVPWRSRCLGGQSYAPGEPDPVDAAEDITMGEGQTRSGIDVTLDPFVNIYNVDPPTVNKNPRVGTTLTATDGTWSPDGVAVTHEWLVDGVVVATGNQFTPLPAQKGWPLVLRSTGSKTAGEPRTITTQLGLVAPGVFSTTTAPVVTGQAKVGHQLSVTTGAYSPTPKAVKRTWCVNSLCYSTGTITLKKAMRGKKIYVRVEASGPGFASKRWISPKMLVK